MIYAFYSKTDIRSLNNFFNYIKANHNKIFTGDFYEKVNWGDEIEETKVDFGKKSIIDEVKECEQMIEERKELIDKIGEFRHNYYAHFGNIKKGKENFIYLKELEEALNLIERIIQKFQIRYDRVVKSFRLMNVSDVSNIGHILELYENNKEELIKLDEKKRYGIED